MALYVAAAMAAGPLHWPLRFPAPAAAFHHGPAHCRRHGRRLGRRAALMPGRSPLWLLAGLVVVLAIGGPGSMIGFDFARTFNPAHRIGTATGIVNVGGFIAALVAIFLIGAGAGHPVRQRVLQRRPLRAGTVPDRPVRPVPAHRASASVSDAGLPAEGAPADGGAGRGCSSRSSGPRPAAAGKPGPARQRGHPPTTTDTVPPLWRFLHIAKVAPDRGSGAGPKLEA